VEGVDFIYVILLYIGIGILTDKILIRYVFCLYHMSFCGICDVEKNVIDSKEFGIILKADKCWLKC